MRWPGARAALANCAPAEMRAPVSDLPIVFSEVSLAAGRNPILDRVPLTIPSGAPTVLIGPNGAGKTTLIRLAAGLLAHWSGRIEWGGSAHVHGERIAIVFQRPVMLRRSVAANIAYALRDRREAAPHVSELLRRV